MTMDPGRRLRSGPSYSDSISGSRVESLYPLRKGARLKVRVTLDVIPRLVAAGDEEKAYMELEVRNVAAWRKAVHIGIAL